jgi:hypothetical protein
MIDEAQSETFTSLYTQWGDAIANKQHGWLEGFFSEDFLGTAQPWPTLIVNKQQMIDLDKAIEEMDTEWVSVKAFPLGDIVVTLGVVRYHNETFKEGATIGDGMPTGDQISGLTAGKLAVYVNGWRHNGERWQVFDHHLVSVIDDPEANK